jgi:hypothetical protein
VEIRDLEYLAASASAGNFARAAKALGCNNDAAAAGADWKEVAGVMLHLDPEREPDRARRAWETHLARAHWMNRARLPASAPCRRAALSASQDFPRLDTGPVRGAGAERCFLLCIKGSRLTSKFDIRG